MPLLREQVYWPSAFNRNTGDWYTATWEINIPPSPVLAKLCLSSASAYSPGLGGDGILNVAAALVSARRRKADGSDEQINFPGFFGPDVVEAYYDDKLTNVTYGVALISSFTRLMFILEYWS